jgi:hypothetical protein
MRAVQWFVYVCIGVPALFGCTAIGVPQTADPGQKLMQAYSLMAQERFPPAEPLIREARGGLSEVLEPGAGVEPATY